MSKLTSRCKWNKLACAGVGVLIGVTCSDLHRCYYYGCSHSLWLSCYNYIRAVLLSKHKDNISDFFVRQRQVYEAYFGTAQSSLLSYSFSPKELTSMPSRFEQKHLPMHLSNSAGTEIDSSANKQNECTVLCLTCEEAHNNQHRAKEHHANAFSPQ